jgi:hypothetical protein
LQLILINEMMARVGDLPFTALPGEDAGASTASRFRFQHCCAAARLFAAIAAEKECELVCEWHEDYLVVSGSPVLAVSVKHREQNRSKWTVAALTSDGKLGHLLDTFQRANEDLDCLFETNRVHDVAALWSPDSQKRNQLVSELAERLHTDGTAITKFVARLRLVDDLPSREHIAATYASMLAAPALDRLKLDIDEATAMRVAGDLIANASSEQLSPEALQKVLLAPAHQRDAVLAEQKIADRRVRSDELAAALHEAASEMVPWLPNDDPEMEVPAETTLSRKLEAGGLGPSVKRSAGRRRARWYAHRARHRDIGYREGELDSIEEWVQDQANIAETTARKDHPDDYGPQMFEDLTRALSSREALPPGTRREDSDPALLAGAAFELTDACSVWFSPESSLADDAA